MGDVAGERPFLFVQFVALPQTDPKYWFWLTTTYLPYSTSHRVAATDGNYVTVTCLTLECYGYIGLQCYF